MNYPFLFLCMIMAAVLFGCQGTGSVSLESEREAILTLHHAQRSHHFQKDSISFANQMSDSFISVNRGIISRPSREDNISRYHAYFSSVEFEKWDDVSDPIIRFSDDGKMAYTIVDKVVEVVYPDQNGNSIHDKTHYAWTTIYRKSGDEWKVECVTSTNKPEP